MEVETRDAAVVFLMGASMMVGAVIGANTGEYAPVFLLLPAAAMVICLGVLIGRALTHPAEDHKEG